MLPITVVCATRHDERDFYLKSALGRSLRKTYQDIQVQQKIYFKNSRALAAVYNDAINTSPNENEILVFIHDDVLLVDFFWVERLREGLTQFQVLGVAGNIRRVPYQPSWCFINRDLDNDDEANLSGAIGHGRSFPCEVARFGPASLPCKLLDGVVLITSRGMLIERNIRFDDRFRFHFYDMDFCRQCEEQGVSMGTVPLVLIHESAGNFGGKDWVAGYEAYVKKWKG